jgi:signal transduction histidine kinase
MFSTRLREFTRSLGFRLNLGYMIVFTVCAGALLWAVYNLLSVAVDQKDRAVVEGRLRESIAVYNAGGEEGLRQWITQLQTARQKKMFYTALLQRGEPPRVLSIPDEWEDVDLRLVGEPEKMRGRPIWRRIEVDDTSDITASWGETAKGAALEVARKSDSRQALMGRFQWIFTLSLPPLALLGFLTGAIMARRTTRPLQDLALAVRSIVETGQMTVRVPTRKASDELSELVALFNEMLGRNESLLRAMKESLDNVAHDVRTPLTRLRFVAEQALDSQDLPEGCKAPLRECIEETEHIQTIIQTLLEVARAEGGVLNLNRQQAEVAPLIQDAVELYEHVADEKKIALTFKPQCNCRVIADPVRLRRAFANLLDNAIKYTPSGGRVEIRMEKDAARILVHFRDTGVGIEPGDLPRIWERLYRADKSRNEHGLGLGLSLVKAIIEAKGGTVSAKSEPGEGSEFTVCLPEAGNDGEPCASGPAVV